MGHRLLQTALWTLFFALPLTAQVDTGAITGTVSDTSGGVIARVAVRIESEHAAYGLSVLSDEHGFYSAPGLRPDTYRITAKIDGFQAETRAGIQVRVQDRLSIDFRLQPGQANATITVVGEAPPLESATSSLGKVVGEKAVKDLPLNGRNFIKLALLGSGTLPAARSGERDTFIANGARSIQNSYLLDGIENKNKIVGFDASSAQVIQPVIDGIQEFKVQTSTFSAEFGQAAGAVVNVTLKSGTNAFHGSAFEFLRNSEFDAKPYFQPTSQKPQFIQNQFGATFGGPIIRNRTFFFASWQSWREVNAAPQTGSVPLDSVRNGIFTTPVYDPASTRPNPSGSGYVRDLFPGNQVPRSVWDPSSAKLAALYPAPNLPGAVQNFFYNPKERISNDQVNVRVDHQFRERDNFFARVSTSPTENQLPGPLPSPANDPSIVNLTGISYAGSESHIFRPNLVNEFRFGYTFTREQQQIASPRLFDQYGIVGVPNDPVIHGLPTFAITGLNTLGTTGLGTLPTAATGSGNLPLDKQDHVYQFNDNLSWVNGRHTLKFGGDFQQVTLYGFVTLQARPSFSFNGVYTQNPQSRSGTGAAFADCLLGYSNDSLVSTRARNESRQHIAQGYVQDDWAVNSRLTLNIGLRYELPFPFYETRNQESNIILDPKSPLYGQILDAHDAGRYGFNRSMVNADYNNLAPRAGFAYKVNDRTVVRSGFGVFYGRDENLGISSRLTNNPPYFIRTEYLSDQINPAVVVSKGFPAGALNPATVVNPQVNTYPTDFPIPYVLEWNFNLQRELPHGLVAQLSYVGSGGRKLYITRNVNLPTPGPGNIDARRPVQGYSSISQYAPLVDSTYHSFQAQLERRFHAGLSFVAAYTWSHSIDNSGANVDSGDVGPQNPLDFAANRGNSNFDVRHRLSVSYVYELPFGRGKPFLHQSAILRAIGGGWQIMGITTAQTGVPFTPVLSFDPTNSGITARPNRLSDGSLPASQRDPKRWFDTAAFVAPVAYNYGNSGRGILRGPGLVNVDVGLTRRVRVTERVGLEIRGEAFNLLNTPQFGIPNATIGSASAGVISTVVNRERQI